MSRAPLPLPILVLPSPSFMPPILFGASTPMRPESNHGTKERGTGWREKEEITLYCILVNWRGRGEKIGRYSDRSPFSHRILSQLIFFMRTHIPGFWVKLRAKLRDWAIRPVRAAAHRTFFRGNPWRKWASILSARMLGEGLEQMWSEYEQIPTIPFWEKFVQKTAVLL